MLKSISLVFACLLLINVVSYAQSKKLLTLEDFILSDTFYSQSIDEISPMNDDEYFTNLVNNSSIVKYSFKNGEASDTLFSLAKVDDCPVLSITGYRLSKNEDRILIETNKKKIYRHSYVAENYVWDKYTETLYPVSDYGPQQVATFSPDGERVAFVRDNNIYIKTIRFGTEQQVTFDGEKNQIINGIPDWVYEEEFAYTQAYAWSPDSKMLAYVKFDESEVPEISIPMYKGLSPEMEENSLYPGTLTYKYPKAGEKNSQVTVHVYNIKTRATIKMDTGEDTDIYIPKIVWEPTGNDLGILKLNRRQNELVLLYANPYTGQTRTVITENNSRFIDDNFLRFFTYLDDNEHFVIMSERNGWSHLYLYKNNGFISKQLTKGNFDVTDFYGYDTKKEILYYQAARKSPLEREIYSVSLDGKKEECLTGNTGEDRAIFSSGFSYFISFFSSYITPPLITINSTRNKKVRVLEDNADLKEKLSDYNLPDKDFFSFSTSGGVELNGYMLKPSTFDESGEYPLVIYQYSGPKSQEVMNRWDIDWHWFLAEQGYIVAFIDPRGTDARGEDFRKCTYMQLGKLESDDLVEAARYLGSLSFIDEKNMAIWGWSYGGFMTALCMEKGGETFKAGVAVAPVTNWRFYDSVYTERYMRKPQENPDGYDDNSPISNPEGIKGNLLIVHGTADDNVHAQNTYEFTEALVQADVQFDMHLYTNRDHGIYGGNTRMHLFKKIYHFFESNLK
ncbi:MAG: DPP IV N-terminal domain-containing protein [Prolixibacteraceae bacterium]|nr:DPP IV N-terminal domain-containing protein [Prolixibacteraceae bacterium]